MRRAPSNFPRRARTAPWTWRSLGSSRARASVSTNGCRSYEQPASAAPTHAPLVQPSLLLYVRSAVRAGAGVVRRDNLLGRVVIDLSQLAGRTVYDCVYPLQHREHKRLSGKRGFVRYVASAVQPGGAVAPRAAVAAASTLPIVETHSGSHARCSSCQASFLRRVGRSAEVAALSNVRPAAADVCGAVQAPAHASPLRFRDRRPTGGTVSPSLSFPPPLLLLSPTCSQLL